MRKCVAIVLHFRSDARTASCVASLAREGVPRVIIVDNSEDGGRSLLRLRAALDGVLATCDYVEPGRNLGYSAGINAGLDVMGADLGVADVLVINSDATLEEGTLARLIDAVAGEAPVVAAPRIDGPTGLVVARTYYRHLSALITPRGPGWSGHALLGGACLMVHRALIGNGPLFDEQFFFYGDDIEFGHRMAREGVALVDVPDGTVIHEGSAGSGNGSLFYEYHMTRAHLLMVGKLGQGTMVRIAMMLGRAVVLPLRALVRSFRFRNLNAWRGLFLAARDVALGRVQSFTPPANGP